MASILGGSGFGQSGGSILGGQPPRIPWGSNPMVTMAGLSLLGAPTLQQGFQNVAQNAPYAMNAKTQMQDRMLAQQEKAQAEADRKRRAAAMSAWMRSQSGMDLSPEELSIVEGSPEVGEALFGASVKKRFEPTEAYRPLTDPAERAQFGIAPDDTRPYQLGPGNKLSAVGGGGTSVSIDTVGTIPQGYELVKDPVTGAKQMRRIPGGPADTSKQDAAASENRQMKADIVTQDIDRTLKAIESSPGTTTGIGGTILKNIPGSGAANVSSLLDTVKANVGFGQLQAMRDASPTGGALGQVSEQENRLLQSVLGSVEQSQSQEQLTYNLKRLKNIYLDIIHGPGNGPPREPLEGGGGDGSDGWTEIEPGVRIREKP